MKKILPLIFTGWFLMASSVAAHTHSHTPTATEQEAETAIIASSCDVFPGCPLSLYGDKVTLVLPDELYAERLLDISLEFKQPVTEITAQLAGVSMYMGKIPVIFSKQEAGNSYLAKTIVARCGSHMMTWRLAVSWLQDGMPHYGYQDIVVANPP
ncbi:MAG: hypothetical protein HRU23_04515 [Gammaproteobacteria bacterium]|nr:hypothetical protein [Gammaproteobacteria bacterium]